MELTQIRKTKTDTTTIGDFEIDGTFFSHGLEPKDRGLTSDMSLEDIAAIKVPDKTAVPIGRYQVVSYDSPKWGMKVPCLIDIPGFDKVEIHVGNFAKDTDACLLLGYGIGPDQVLQSRDAIKQFYQQFFAALDNGEEVWITYQDA